MPSVEEQIAGAFEQVAARVALFVAVRYGLTPEESQDVVHDVFSALIDRASRGEIASREPEHWQNYIIAAAQSRAIDALRGRSRVRKNEAILLSSILSGEREAVEARMIAAERQASLRQAIEALPPRYRRIFELLLDRELSLAEVARVLGISPGTIYTQYARGIEKLRRALEER